MAHSPYLSVRGKRCTTTVSVSIRQVLEVTLSGLARMSHRAMSLRGFFCRADGRLQVSVVDLNSKVVRWHRFL